MVNLATQITLNKKPFTLTSNSFQSFPGIFVYPGSPHFHPPQFGTFQLFGHGGGRGFNPQTGGGRGLTLTIVVVKVGHSGIPINLNANYVANLATLLLNVGTGSI
ncbi:LOW QUALITY PROTEIN: hypothetical protein TorRG33x02_341750 [Trema orientale]|uniref:Uncharacterized protein n=1 Tax=Trema orientale TaxID=63057 RepID=A0A2P5ATF3_TREOI|nr:LOW QUALITY PROTEIN: hypothetical protein TorRG33x02_341750 [Trema orientale]